MSSNKGTTIPRTRRVTTGGQNGLLKALGRPLSKFRNLLHISDSRAQSSKHEFSSASPGPPNGMKPLLSRSLTHSVRCYTHVDSVGIPTPTSSSLVSSLSAILETIEPAESNSNVSTFLLSPALTSRPYGHIGITVPSVDHPLHDYQPVSTTSSLTSPFSTSPQVLTRRDTSSSDAVTTSTVASIFNAYEEEGITDNPALVTAELEMYLPVTRAMVRILLTKTQLFPGQSLAATRLAISLETSCNEVEAFLSLCDDMEIVSPCGPANLDCIFEPGHQPLYHENGRRETISSGSTAPMRKQAGSTLDRVHRSPRELVKSSKQNLKCSVANLLMKIPGRGPPWLVDRVLLWTIVGEYRCSQESSDSRVIVTEDIHDFEGWNWERGTGID